MQTFKDKISTFIINTALILGALIILARMYYYFFSFYTGLIQEQCYDGYLSAIHKEFGKVTIVQILDKNNKPIKCKE